MSEYTIDGNEIRKGTVCIATYDEKTNAVTSKEELPAVYKGAIKKLLSEVNSGPVEFYVPPVEKKTETPAPPMDAALGDKTPAYIEWYRENHTEEEFEAKYRDRIAPELI